LTIAVEKGFLEVVQYLVELSGGHIAHSYDNSESYVTELDDMMMNDDLDIDMMVRSSTMSFSLI
jgi:hypothetical protein